MKTITEWTKEWTTKTITNSISKTLKLPAQTMRTLHKKAKTTKTKMMTWKMMKIEKTIRTQSSKVSLTKCRTIIDTTLFNKMRQSMISPMYNELPRPSWPSMKKLGLSESGQYRSPKTHLCISQRIATHLWTGTRSPSRKSSSAKREFLSSFVDTCLMVALRTGKSASSRLLIDWFINCCCSIFLYWGSYNGLFQLWRDLFD